jgi:hypothetical protein
MNIFNLNQIKNNLYLKVVKNNFVTLSKLEGQTNRIYINTIVPGFIHKNSAGESVAPNKFILL